MEEWAWVRGVAGDADEVVEGTVEVCRSEARVGARVEGVYVYSAVLVGMGETNHESDSIREGKEQNVLCVTTSLT